MPAPTISWRMVERTHAIAPERVTSVLIAGFAAKMIFFGIYVGLLGALWLRPQPLVVAFAASFVVLHVIEAGYLRKLIAGAQAVNSSRRCMPQLTEAQQAAEAASGKFDAGETIIGHVANSATSTR